MFKIVAAWFVAFAMCFFIVKFTTIGPVIFVISEEYSHGVHLGDLIILFPLAAAAFLTWKRKKS